jgi:phospholipase/lecithinase/hemolysin
VKLQKLVCVATKDAKIMALPSVSCSQYSDTIVMGWGASDMPQTMNSVQHHLGAMSQLNVTNL